VRAARGLLCHVGMKHTILVLGALLFVGCGSGDSSGSGTEEPTNLPPGSGEQAPGGASGSTGGAPPSSGSTPPGSTPPGSTPPGTTPPTGTASGAFAGAPPYVPTLGPSTIDTSGKGNGHLSFNPTGNPAGKPCLDCHDGTGKGGAPKFLFAGTIYADAAGTKVVPKAEVRLLGADNKGLSAYTDENGNFFFRAAAGAFVAPAVAGARTATKTTSMVNKINDANCNQCHGTTQRVTL
jgi:hypothetical protein